MSQQQSTTPNQPPSRGLAIIEWIGVGVFVAVVLVGIWAILTNQSIVIALLSLGLTVLGIIISIWRGVLKILSHLWQTIKIGLIILLIVSIVGNVYQFVYNANTSSTSRNTSTLPPLSDFLRDVRGSFDFADRLQRDDHRDGWDNRQGSCSFEDDGYHASVTGTPMSCLNKSMLGNFALQVKVKIMRGEQVGLVFRWTGNGPFTYYVFSIKTGGKCGLGTTIRNNYHSLPIPEMNTCYLNAGQSASNQIAVIAVGNTINLYINGHHLGNRSASFIDTTYYPQLGQQGEFGMDVGDPSGQETAAVFSDLQVWTYDASGVLSQ